jgi:hypothetical protein
VLHTLDPNEYLVHVLLVSWQWEAGAQAVGETRTGFLAPAPDRLIGNDNATLSQEQLDIPQTEAEDAVQPDSVADDLSGEPMTIAWVGWRLRDCPEIGGCRRERYDLPTLRRRGNRECGGFWGWLEPGSMAHRSA